jgi:hypothetical protein
VVFEVNEYEKRRARTSCIVYDKHNGEDGRFLCVCKKGEGAMKEYKPAIYAHQFAKSNRETGERTNEGDGIYLGCNDRDVTEKSYTNDGELLPEIVEFYSANDFEELQSRLESLEKDAARYKAWESVMNEVDRRSEKELCLEEKRDFTVTVTYEEYLAIDTAMQSEKGGV